MSQILTELDELVHSFTAKDGTEVILRQAKEEDAQDIVTHVQAILEIGEYIQKEKARSVAEEEKVIREMRDKKNMYMVVEIEGEAVGIARLIRGELEMKKHTAVFRTWIHEKAQGKGIGKKIMEYTLEWGKLSGLKKIWLTVFSDNEVAYKLYERYGFKKEGVQVKQAYLNGYYQDEIYMGYFYEDEK